MTERELIKKAKKNVKKKKAFYIHLGVYACCIPFFFAINYLTWNDEPDPMWWAFFPTLAWGVAVGIHYFATFGWTFGDSDWEDKLMEKEVSKLFRKHNIEEDIDEEITVPKDELELREFKRLRKDWEDGDFV